MEEYNKFREIKDKFNSLYMIIARNITKDELLDFINNKLNNIKKVKDKYKRDYLVNRLYSFKEYLEDSDYNKSLNHVFFISNVIDEVIISKNSINILNDYNFPNIIIKSDNIFDIDYLNELLYDTIYKSVIEIKNDNLYHCHINKTKGSKNIKECKINKNYKIQDYLKDIREKTLIHGVSIHLKNLKLNNHLVFRKRLDNTEIFNVFMKEEMKVYHKELKKCLSLYKRTDINHKIVIGKDIVKAMKYNLLEKIYCIKEKEKILKDNFSKYLDNIKIIIIEEVEKGDIVSDFNNECKGIIGVKYY